VGERAGDRARTDDLLITNQTLYQLSYTGPYFPWKDFPFKKLSLRPSKAYEYYNMRERIVNLRPLGAGEGRKREQNKFEFKL
jgi:hypothetical protein